MKRNLKKNSGFTLIELVVVIAIIGVLASIIAPRVRLSLMKAKDAKVVATLNTLRTAANLYYAESGSVIGLNTGASTNLTNQKVLDLISAGYLEEKSAKALIGSAAAADQFSMPAGVVQTYNATNCTAVGTPKSTAVYTPGSVPFIIGTDGVNILIDAPATAVDARCNYWNSL